MIFPIDLSFIKQMNNYLNQNQAFFFLIDFEQKKPFICTLDTCHQHGIYFSILNNDNLAHFHKAPKQQQEQLYFEVTPALYTDYQQSYQQVKNEIQYGNSYLLNLTYPTKIDTTLTLPQIFEMSQAPYKLLFKDQFVCFSPESFIQIQDQSISTFPMKGTINASHPDAENTLIQSIKERYEHNTIVDLMRNDLSIIAQNIEVKRYRYVEKIQSRTGSVLQTSSEIHGKLPANWRDHFAEALISILPAGSISGAPKQKTVEIIQKVEAQERGYYTGIFGIFDGEKLYSAVAIRYIEQRQDKIMQFRSGGGITAMSHLDDEYQELLTKVYLPFIQENQGQENEF